MASRLQRLELEALRLIEEHRIKEESLSEDRRRSPTGPTRDPEVPIISAC
jgi:hypothetical protein